MAQRLWDGTETLFTLVRFDRSLTHDDIAKLAEPYLEFASLKYDDLIATIGHYPEREDLPPSAWLPKTNSATAALPPRTVRYMRPCIVGR